MTVIVAYAPRPEGQTALEKGLEIAKRNNERLIVVNASPGGNAEDPSAADADDFERIQRLLAQSGLDAEAKQFIRGKSPVEEIVALVEANHARLLVMGLRKRSAIGKFILGSVAQELLLSAPCPVLAVKAGQ